MIITNFQVRLLQFLCTWSPVSVNNNWSLFTISNNLQPYQILCAFYAFIFIIYCICYRGMPRSHSLYCHTIYYTWRDDVDCEVLFHYIDMIMIHG